MQDKMRRSVFKQAAKDGGGSRHHMPVEGSLLGVLTRGEQTIKQLEQVTDTQKEGQEISFLKKTLA